MATDGQSVGERKSVGVCERERALGEGANGIRAETVTNVVIQDPIP